MEVKLQQDEPVSIDEIVSIETVAGPAQAFTFRNLPDGKEHIVFSFGSWRNQSPARVRVHSECLTGDVFGSKRCDCGPQLHEAIHSFSRYSGLLIYLRQEGRGIGLNNKMRAYRLQDSGLNTYEANLALGFHEDERNFAVAGAMLKAMGISEITLVSNNPRKAAHLRASGITIRDQLTTGTYVNKSNRLYLKAKANFGGHHGLDKKSLNGGFDD